MPKLTVTDVCLVTRDLEPAISFYTEKLGFGLARRMPGYADFEGHGVTLALWDAEAIRDATGVPIQMEKPTGRGVMIAVKLESPGAVDKMFAELSGRGVDFYGPPRDHAWTARVAYFPGPCDEFWELYAWLEDGEPGAVPPARPS